MHSASINIQQSNMPNVMSKMLLLGMSLQDVLVRSTVNPAKVIGRYPELGTLGVGPVADIAVLEEESGVFAFKDAWPAKMLGTKRLECAVTLRGGNVVYQRPGRSGPVQAEDRPYDLLFKHAHIGDQDVDVAVVGNKIVRIGRGLKAAHGRVVVEAEGYDVTLAQGGTGDITVFDGSRPILTVRGGKIIRDDEG